MKDNVFVDTNILIYAHDMDAGSKHDVAVSIIKNIWESLLVLLPELYQKC